MADGPLTVGTAGHVDHGKTALVAALTGVDTDRLAEEKRRGLSIELGFADLVLQSGRHISLVDVPGHERFIRTMVAGATGIDCYMMVIAATEGVRTQTVDHARILRALRIDSGIVVITKTDLADPSAACRGARELFPGAPIVICPGPIADRRESVLAALERVAGSLAGRASRPDQPTILHVDRCFTVAGAGTVVTGTLGSGRVSPGDRLVVYPQELTVRVRGVQVHSTSVTTGLAGQRVAINLARVSRAAIARGDVVATEGAVGPSHVLAVELDGALDGADGRPRRLVYVHHGTRATLAQVKRGTGATAGMVSLRCRTPVMARPGDRLVLRDAGCRETLGGAVVIADRGPRRVADGATRPAGGTARRVAPPPPVAPEPAPRMRAVESELRVLIARDGAVTLPGIRDHLGVSRRDAKALLDYFDAIGLTLRRADDTRVLRRSATGQ